MHCVTIVFESNNPAKDTSRMKHLLEYIGRMRIVAVSEPRETSVQSCAAEVLECPGCDEAGHCTYVCEIG